MISASRYTTIAARYNAARDRLGSNRSLGNQPSGEFHDANGDTSWQADPDVLNKPSTLQDVDHRQPSGSEPSGQQSYRP